MKIGNKTNMISDLNHLQMHAKQKHLSCSTYINKTNKEH